jgi:hypothetical protein
MGAAAMSANAGVNFGFSIGFPMPVIVSTPVAYPAPVAVVQPTPPCPGAGYLWTSGYWSVYPTGRVWVPGAWRYHPTVVVYGRDRDDRHNGHDWNRGHDREGHNGHDRDGYRR